MTQYIITRDSVSTLRNKYNLKLSTLNSKLIELVSGWFLDRIVSHMTFDANDTLKIVEERETLEHISETLSNEALPVVSLDTVYFPGVKLPNSYELSVQRYLSSIKDQTGYLDCRKEEYASVEEQITALKAKGINECAIWDVGIQSGGTLVELIKQFQDKGIGVSKVYVLTASRKGLEQVKLECKDTEIKAKYVIDGRWLEERSLNYLHGNGVDHMRYGFGRYMPDMELFSHLPEEMKRENGWYKMVNMHKKEIFSLSKTWSNILQAIVAMNNPKFRIVHETNFHEFNIPVYRISY
jgi:hypothetical protein